jgi:hypothetical protein
LESPALLDIALIRLTDFSGRVYAVTTKPCNCFRYLFFPFVVVVVVSVVVFVVVASLFWQQLCGLALAPTVSNSAELRSAHDRDTSYEIINKNRFSHAAEHKSSRESLNLSLHSDRHSVY